MRFLMVLVLVVLTATPAAAAPAPDVVTGRSAELHPEGIAWDPLRQAFLLGSLRHGTVEVVRDGTTKTLISDPRMVSTFGVHVVRGRVYVAYGDMGLGLRSTPDTTYKSSGLGVFDLATGRPVVMPSGYDEFSPRAAARWPGGTAREGAGAARTDPSRRARAVVPRSDGIVARAGTPPAVVQKVQRDADWDALPADTPIALRRLLQRCLEKDAKARLRDIGEACNRVRVTCTGTLYMCLGQEDAADLRAPLRSIESATVSA